MIKKDEKAASADVSLVIACIIELLRTADLNFLILRSSISLYFDSRIKVFSSFELYGIEINIG